MIRRLTAADWEAYRTLRLEALAMAPEAFASDLTEQKELPPEYWQSRAAGGPNAFMLGAFQGDALVGIAGLVREDRRKTRHKADVVSVYVSPTARGIGTGRRLLEALIAEARRLGGITQLTLTVVSENRVARQLYLNLGFTVYGTEPRSLRVGDRYLDEDDMVLFL